MGKDELMNRMQYALDLNEKKASDLVKDLGIPKSAISQYLSGRSKKMSADRLYAIAKYLHVSEAWLMGYDVPMERKTFEELLGDLADKKIEEDALLADFRKLNDKGKELARVYVRSLSQMRDYNIEEAAP